MKRTSIPCCFCKNCKKCEESFLCSKAFGIRILVTVLAAVAIAVTLEYLRTKDMAPGAEEAATQVSTTACNLPSATC